MTKRFNNTTLTLSYLNHRPRPFNYIALPSWTLIRYISLFLPYPAFTLFLRFHTTIVVTKSTFIPGSDTLLTQTIPKSEADSSLSFSVAMCKQLGVLIVHGVLSIGHVD